MTQFIDLHIKVRRIEAASSLSYAASVIDAPIQFIDEPFELVCKDDKAVKEALAGDWNAIAMSVRAASGQGRTASQQETAAGRPATPTETVGEALLNYIFPVGSRLRSLLLRSIDSAGSLQCALTLRLNLDHELYKYPWELLPAATLRAYGSQMGRVRVCVVRDLGHPPIDVGSNEPLGRRKVILVVLADPQGPSHDPVVSESFKAEWKTVSQTINGTAQGDDIEARLVAGPDTLGSLGAELESCKREGMYVVGLHLMAHGNAGDRYGDSFLLGEGPNGEVEPIHGDNLLALLDDHQALQWCLFSACGVGSSNASNPESVIALRFAYGHNVPLVLAYQRPVETNDALRVARAFYERVLGGAPVEELGVGNQFWRGNPGGLVILRRPSRGGDNFNAGIRKTAHGQRFDVGTPPASQRQRVEPAAGPAEPQKARTTTSANSSSHRLSGVEPARGEMVRIPRGTYRRGLTEAQSRSLLDSFRRSGMPIDFRAAERVLRQEVVENRMVEAFEIALTPVTNAEFDKFVRAMNYQTSAEEQRSGRTWRDAYHADRADHPVVNVSCYDAMAYCRWARLRLPTSDEWKRACRGEEGRIFPWGDIYDPQKCNTAESCAGQETTPVYAIPAGCSPFGLYDMVGNVEEWTATVQNGRHVILGGSWAMPCLIQGSPLMERMALPDYLAPDQGFRCAR